MLIGKHPHRLIDVAYYSAEARTKFAGSEHAYDHFVNQGSRQALNPSPYFFTKWYAWQNSVKDSDVLEHFASHALHRCIDPAPFVDMVSLLREFPQAENSLTAYAMLLKSEVEGLSKSLNVHLGQLAAARQRFSNQITLRLLRDCQQRRRHLVWVQCGKAFRFGKWFSPKSPRTWDLLENWYDTRFMDLRFGDIVLQQRGTKFTAIHNILRLYPHILHSYDSVVFLDDDLVFRHEDVDRLFALAESHELDMFQASLSSDSFGTWPDLFHYGHQEVHLTTGVEVMMFGFTKRALTLCGPLFEHSVSGFGLDQSCSQTILDAGWRCGVVNAVQATHPDPIDESAGSYYEQLRAAGVKPKLELFEAASKIGCFPDFRRLTPRALPERRIMSDTALRGQIHSNPCGWPAARATSLGISV